MVPSPDDFRPTPAPASSSYARDRGLRRSRRTTRWIAVTAAAGAAALGVTYSRLLPGGSASPAPANAPVQNPTAPTAATTGQDDDGQESDENDEDDNGYGEDRDDEEYGEEEGEAGRAAPATQPAPRSPAPQAPAPQSPVPQPPAQPPAPTQQQPQTTTGAS
ncbi:hypothetical protein [Streptomyces sp. NPDC048623]|uniref:hypothetical protein n=1 Tax=Streptomyces sp. NPDC048623 TaxID=3155761 RepID=UPI00343344B4